MRCKFAVFKRGFRVECTKVPLYCPFQYWCSKERIYKCTGTKDKCKYYEEAELQDTAEKTKTE